ncbi:hypothetical protein QUH73_18970 [Labilibaculum sp. K2S]|uniref:hypothetical protein n=1 Tax=Labilibaculum sp. K2S TaxID=3056386 RepID=UPI0025A36525|nr:hypothetical protein [Labilibaculum sp. K2S]MDM8161907.1 hypothetical protein [Labilibaculum sp. K2S]
MKQPIKNIISIVLLVFYLAGFCGIHLLKHSCSSCDHSEVQVLINSDTECSNCPCETNHHSDENHSYDQANNLCCDFDLVYLKTNPRSIINKTNKAPNASKLVLLISYAVSIEILFTPEPHAEEFKDYNSNQKRRIKPDVLCCFNC